MSFKLTTNGGLQLARPRSMEKLQAEVLAYYGRLPLYVRNCSEADLVVLEITKARVVSATRHSTPLNSVAWPDWMNQLAMALSKIDQPMKEPSND